MLLKEVIVKFRIYSMSLLPLLLLLPFSSSFRFVSHTHNELFVGPTIHSTPWIDSSCIIIWAKHISLYNWRWAQNKKTIHSYIHLHQKFVVGILKLNECVKKGRTEYVYSFRLILLVLQTSKSVATHFFNDYHSKPSQINVLVCRKVTWFITVGDFKIKSAIFCQCHVCVCMNCWAFHFCNSSN